MSDEAVVEMLNNVFTPHRLLKLDNARDQLDQADIEAIRTLAAKMAAAQLAVRDGGASTLVRVAHEMVLGPIDLLMKRLAVYTKFWSGLSPLIVEDWPLSDRVIEYDPNEDDATEKNAALLTLNSTNKESYRTDRSYNPEIEEIRSGHCEKPWVIEYRQLHTELYEAFKKSGYADALGDMTTVEVSNMEMWHGTTSIARLVPRAAWLLYAEFTGVAVAGLVVSQTGKPDLPVRTLHGAWFLAAHKTVNNGPACCLKQRQEDGHALTSRTAIQTATFSPALLLQKTAWMVASALLADADLSRVGMLPRNTDKRSGVVATPSPPPSFWLQFAQMVVQLKFAICNSDGVELWSTSWKWNALTGRKRLYDETVRPKTAMLTNIMGASNPIGHTLALYWMQEVDVPAATALFEHPVLWYFTLNYTFEMLIKAMQMRRDRLFQGGDDNPDLSAKSVRMKYDVELLTWLSQFVTEFKALKEPPPPTYYEDNDNDNDNDDDDKYDNHYDCDDGTIRYIPGALTYDEETNRYLQFRYTNVNKVDEDAKRGAFGNVERDDDDES